MLASITSHQKLPCVLEKSGPIEAHLKSFGNSLVWTKVSTTGRSLVMMKGIMDLIFWQTFSIGSVSTMPVEERRL